MSTDKRTIKSYDSYAEKWSRLARSEDNLYHTYLEKPAMYGELPPIKGKAVLCVGCGTGEECFYLKSLEAKRVVGIDISEGLIKLAKTNYPNLEFYVMDMDKLDFPQNSFDYVFSHLAMHYLPNWTKTLRNIRSVMKNGSEFLFSTHHPIKWGAQVKRERDKESFLIGFIKYFSGKYEVFGDYLNTRKVSDTWFGDFPVVYYHRPLSAIVKDILASGFQIVDFIEPKPLGTVKGKSEAFWEIYSKIPLFMIFKLKKI